jgi:hypothetical protein
MSRYDLRIVDFLLIPNFSTNLKILSTFSSYLLESSADISISMKFPRFCTSSNEIKKSLSCGTLQPEDGFIELNQDDKEMYLFLRGGFGAK